MLILLGIALKSLLVAGGTLGLLFLMRSRSASERSWVAHMGLAVLVLIAVSPLVLPSWNVEVPAISAKGSVEPAPVKVETPAMTQSTASPVAETVKSEAAPAPSTTNPVNKLALAVGLYGIVAAALLFITLVALARLVLLRARADVLVDGHWLSALARAQRRMGFKHGTALLTSNELASPISWGLMRPVILLNDRAVEASAEAEAIIAHELAHVARMDWVKLLLARVATALFWFNPLVWLLAREAHQLREEAADDAVLAADITDTDYAQLLVGVARHECPGLLLGAHGVAPSKNSLSRRVARVLDAASARAPAARPFAFGVLVGATLLAAPLAAMTLIAKSDAPAASLKKLDAGSNLDPTSPYYQAADLPTDLPGIISQGVATSVTGAVQAISSSDWDSETVSPSGASVRSKGGLVVVRAPNGATVTTYPADANGRQKVVSVAANGAMSTSYINDRDDDDEDNDLDRAIQMKAVGVTPDYVRAMRAASPALRDADAEEFIQLRALNVTPSFVAAMASAGFRNLDADDLTDAAAVKVSPEYIQSMRAAGFNTDLDGYVEMKAVGVDAAFANAYRRAGYKIRDADQLVELKVTGLDLDELRALPPQPPRPPDPPKTVDR